MKQEGPYREHKFAAKNNDRKNGIAVHAGDMGHQPNWDAAVVEETEPHHWKRCVLEAIWIQKTLHTCNLDCGLTLNTLAPNFTLYGHGVINHHD